MTCVAFSPDSRCLASGSMDRTINLWDVETGECIDTLNGHEGWVTCVAFSPNYQFLASGSTDYTVKLWTVGSKNNPITLQRKGWTHRNGHTASVDCVAFSPNGNILITTSRDGRIKEWAAKQGTFFSKPKRRKR